MNDLTIMESQKFGQVRKVLVDGEWMYVASDVAKALDKLFTSPQFVTKYCHPLLADMQ